MNSEWKAGDLAECVSDRWSRDWPYNPKRGDILRVSKAGLHIGDLALGFEGKPMRQGWDASAFRKIQQDHAPCDMRFAFKMQGVSHAVKNRRARA